MTARVLHGGDLTSRKGINLPGVQVSAPSITDKDKEDVVFQEVEQDLDYIALSFVRRGDDIAELRTLIPNHMLVVAKIEKDSGAGTTSRRSCARRMGSWSRAATTVSSCHSRKFQTRRSASSASRTDSASR